MTRPTSERRLPSASAYFRAFLRHANAEEEGPDQVEWRARVIADIDNIRAALHSALEANDDAALIELTTGVGNTLTLLGVSGEHYGWLQAAIARAPAASPFRASAIYQLGIAEQFRGELREAREHLEASVRLYREVGDENGALWAFAEYAWMVAWEDGLEAALPLYEQGIADADAAGAVGARYSMEYGLAQYMAFAGEFRGRVRTLRAAARQSRDRRALPPVGERRAGAFQRDARRRRRSGGRVSARPLPTQQYAT